MKQFYPKAHLFIGLLLSTAFSLQAQNLQVQSSSFPSLPATSCTNTQLDVNVLLLCINIAHNGNTVNISGSTITVNMDYTLGPICLGALAQTQQNINLGMIPAGTYSVQINGVLNSTTVSTLSANLTVNSCCSAVPSFTVSNDSICVGDSVYFANSSTGANSYQWFENNSSAGSMTNYGKRFNAAGTYNIKLVVTATGCSDSITKSVYVEQPNVDLGADFKICPGQTATLDAGSGRDSVRWKGSSNSRVLTIDSAGTYYVSIYENGCVDSDTVDVSWYPGAFLDLGNDTTICIGDTLYLDATLMGASYTWQDNSTQPVLSVFAGGNYYVQRIDSNGCMASDTISVAIDTCSTFLGEDHFSSQVNLYPNPASDELHIHFGSNEVASAVVSIKGVGGETFYSKTQTLSSQLTSIPVQKLKPGLYLVTLQIDGQIMVYKWVKK